MYDKIKKILAMIIIGALGMAVLASCSINKLALYKFEEGYLESQQEQLDVIIDHLCDEIRNILLLNSVWTDAFEAVDQKDKEWVNNNLTGYVVDSEYLNIDFSMVLNEEENFSVFYAKEGLEDILDIDTLEEELPYKNAVFNDEIFSGIIFIGDVPTLVASSPLYDDDRGKKGGCLLFGRIIDEPELLEIRKSLGVDILTGLKITKNPKYGSKAVFKDGGFEVSFPLRFSEKIGFIDLVYKVDYLKYIYKYQIVATILAMVVAAIIAYSLILWNVNGLASKLTEVIGAVKDISRGNYNLKIKKDKLVQIPEVDELIDSVNIMSGEIEDHIELVQKHSNAVDRKYFEMLRLLTDIVEMNDSYTFHHSSSVAKFANMIGVAIEFKDLDALDLAARFHDVGKISIPSDILNKPGKLTGEEYELIKSHPMNGYKLLNEVDIFNEAKLGVCYHHERYDGSGYPQGLKGYEIPLIAQIISIADVFDAMTSERSYRKALSHEVAKDFIIAEKGKMFNPDLVDIFIRELIKYKFD